MRVRVQKTYKLFIGGQFPRTESGRYFRVNDINFCRASRKDVRDAVKAARGAFGDWSKRSAYNRGQILYRMAEVLETRGGDSKAIDRLVWYAGWSDKYSGLFGTINPINGPFANFSVPEPSGVVGIVCPDEAPLVALVSLLAPVVVAGNTAVILASETAPKDAVDFGEVCATSDVPGGVVNILTGYRAELVPWLANHMDVNAIVYAGQDEQLIKTVQEASATNVKRVFVRRLSGDTWNDDRVAQSPYWIYDTLEVKTVWHPQTI